jgi:DNA-binding HxlR family transcriptional regulator
MAAMGSSDFHDYCSFTKALEHLGDRWSLLIVGELGVFGPQGFNALANGLPGHISRSVLADRLRKLEDLGLVSRAARRARQDPYRLTAAGDALVPTILSLRGWAGAWLPEDPAMIERDPDIVLAWLAQRVDAPRLPDQQAIVEITMRHEGEHRCWLVLEQGIEAYGCLEDPLLDESRYVYVEAGVPVMLALARGRRSWTDALADGSILVFGDPELTEQLPGWFRPADQEPAGRELRPPDRSVELVDPSQRVRGGRGVGHGSMRA